MRQNIKYPLLFIIFVSLICGSFLLSACGSSGRTGFGPYDVTDYSALEAQQELREFHMEQTQEALYGDPYDRYEDRNNDWTDIYGPPDDY